MKRKIWKALGWLVGCILVMGVALYAYGGKQTETYPAYSSYSTQSQGIKALYFLLKVIGFHTARFESSARFLPDGIVMIAVQPQPEIINQPQERQHLQQWIEKGNTLILVDDGKSKYDIIDAAGILPHGYDTNIHANIYVLGNGRVYYSTNVDIFTNQGLKSYTGGVGMIRLLSEIHAPAVLINERYHGMGSGGATWWDILGTSGRIIVLQLVLAAVVFILSRLRRFGKPVTVFETVRRSENEDIYALANIYQKAGADAAVFESYVRNVQKEFQKFLGLTEGSEALLYTFCKENALLKKYNTAELLQKSAQMMHNSRFQVRKAVPLINQLETIRREIKKA